MKRSRLNQTQALNHLAKWLGYTEGSVSVREVYFERLGEIVSRLGANNGDAPTVLDYSLNLLHESIERLETK